MKIYNRYPRNIALAIFCSLTAASLILYGCGGGGGGGGPAPPAPPAAVTADAGDGQVTLNWAPVAGATSYNVYYGTTTGITKTTGTKVGTNITTSTFTVTGLANGTHCFFLVTAVNSVGESGESAVKEATPTPTPTPAAPANVGGAAGASKATINWDASTGATSYNIYYSTLTGVTKTSGTKITGAVSPMDVTGLTNGTAYFFVVTAVNANGESAESIQVSVTPSGSPPPAAPTGVFASSSGAAGTTISWSAVSGATSYNIYWSTTSGVTKTNGTKITEAVSPQVVTGLTVGTTYYFVVTAVNANGESAESFEASPPEPPTGVTATAGNGQVTINWSAVSGATSYNIWWSTTPGVTRTNGTKITGVTSPYTHTGLTNGTTYYYIVKTENSSGESMRSAEVSATPTASATSKAITAFSFATPAATGTITEATHTIAVTVPAGTNVTSLTPTITHTGASINPASGVAQNFTSPVTYTVTAEDSSTQAYTVTVATGTAPAPPTGVTSTPGNGQVTISWNAVSGATSYNIYWSTTTGVTKANGTKITGVVSPALLTNLTSGITYYFVVTAVNAYGESGESSQVDSGPSPGTLRVLPGWTLSGCIDTYTGESNVIPQTLMAAGGSPFAYYQWDSFGFPMGTTVSAFSGVFSSNGGQLSGKSQESVTIKVYDGTTTATGNAIFYVNTISSAPVNGIPGVPCPEALLQQYPSGSFTLDGGVANKPYGATLFAMGGTPPYSWSEDTSYSGSGDFHLSGLTIDIIHGLVRGTLMNSSSGKTLRFKVIVKDSTGETASGPVYSIAVQ